MAAVFASTTPSTKPLIASNRSQASSWRARRRPAAAIAASTSPDVIRTAACNRTVSRPAARARSSRGTSASRSPSANPASWTDVIPCELSRLQRAQQQRVARLARGDRESSPPRAPSRPPSAPRSARRSSDRARSGRPRGPSSSRVIPGEGERLRVGPAGVAVVALHVGGPVRHHRVELLLRGQASREGAVEPAPARGPTGASALAAAKSRIRACDRRERVVLDEVHALQGERALHQVDVGVVEARAGPAARGGRPPRSSGPRATPPRRSSPRRRCGRPARPPPRPRAPPISRSTPGLRRG